MAKRDIDRYRHRVTLTIEKYRHEMLAKTFYSMDVEKRREAVRAPAPGPRTIILEAYRKNLSKQEAYQAMKEINDKLGKNVYTQDVIDEWIEEYYMKKIKGKTNNDNDAR